MSSQIRRRGLHGRRAAKRRIGRSPIYTVSTRISYKESGWIVLVYRPAGTGGRQHIPASALRSDAVSAALRTRRVAGNLQRHTPIRAITRVQPESVPSMGRPYRAPRDGSHEATRYEVQVSATRHDHERIKTCTTTPAEIRRGRCALRLVWLEIPAPKGEQES
jgi:hypothetical protein